MYHDMNGTVRIKKEKTAHTETVTTEKGVSAMAKKENKIRSITEEEYEEYIRRLSGEENTDK